MLGVPALYRMILENDRQDTYDVSSLRYCYCGGDVLPREVLFRWKQRVGVPIYQVYGSTEAGHVTYSRLAPGEPEPMSIGIPLPSRRTKIVNPDTLEPASEGEVGELLITSDHSVKEYLNKPQETLEAFVSLNGAVYYRPRIMCGPPKMARSSPWSALLTSSSTRGTGSQPLKWRQCFKIIP
jgi:long-chain acyl-CoA synthetase